MSRRKKRAQAPICIEQDCSNTVQPRQNWHTMSEAYSLTSDEWHHRCGPCYAKWLCETRGCRITTAAKPYTCDGCRRPIKTKDRYNLAFRTAFQFANYPERVHICSHCVAIPENLPA